MILRMSWRNIWRNRRRAIITIASVLFAVFFCTILYSFQAGVWDKMIDNTLRTQTGHVQVHAKGYWDDKTIDNFMTMDSKTIGNIEHIDNVENVSPRVETFAMVSSHAISKGVVVVGISPEKETGKSNLPIRLTEGSYLDETDNGVLIGEGLKNYLKIGVGDTLAFIGQGYHGSTAAALFPVRGILNLPITEMSNGMVYITLQAAQKFIDMPDGYSGILISIKTGKKLDETMQQIGREIQADTYEILPWHYTMKDLLHTAESDKAFSKLILIILYLIVGFGILGTVIMMTNERRREFAVMISLGMRRSKIKWAFAAELLLMMAVGVIASLLVSIPVVIWFHSHPVEITGETAKMYANYGMEPVLPFAADPIIFITQIFSIFLIACLTLFYPLRVIRKLKITAK